MSKIIGFSKAKEGIIPGATETTYEFKRKRRQWECKHNRLMLDESIRMAECQDCGDQLDPFDVLVDYMNKERKTKRDIARWEAAKAAFDAIQANWSITITEKRIIAKAMDEARD